MQSVCDVTKGFKPEAPRGVACAPLFRWYYFDPIADCYFLESTVELLPQFDY